MQTNIQKIMKIIDQFAPFDSAEDWDNVGLLIGNENRAIDRILLALDLTDQVIDEAIEEGIDLIITHHPIIFKPLSTISNNDPVGSLVLKCIENHIGVIAAHTNLDKRFHEGINAFLAEQIGLENLSILCPEPSESHPDLEMGFGIKGTFEKALSPEAFIEAIKKGYQLSSVRATHLKDHAIKTVAICSGASMDFVDDAIAAKADAFITADVKYHECQHKPLLIVDIGHFESEFIYLEHFKTILDQRFSEKNYDLYVKVSEVNVGEIDYY